MSIQLIFFQTSSAMKCHLLPRCCNLVPLHTVLLTFNQEKCIICVMLTFNQEKCIICVMLTFNQEKCIMCVMLTFNQEKCIICVRWTQLVSPAWTSLDTGLQPVPDLLQHGNQLQLF